MPSFLLFRFIFHLPHFSFSSFSAHISLFSPPLVLRQTGSVSVGQVILGLIGRLMFIQEPGTLTCLSSLLVHILPHSKSQTHWRLTETYTNVLFDDISPSAISHAGMALGLNEQSLMKVSYCGTNLSPYLLHYENAEEKKASLNGFKE